MHEIHFLRPYVLLLFFPIFALIAALIIRSWKAAGPWQNICSKDLLPYILVRKNKFSYFSYLLTSLALLLLVMAMAGPSWQQVPQPLIKQRTGLVVALDLSPGMDAKDIKPSRLQRAIYKISDLLERHKEGQVALIAFSKDPFVVTPLTDDVSTIKNLLPALETKIMPSHGHRANLAVAKASDLLKQSGINHGSILLVTAELSNQEMKASIDVAKDHGHSVSVLGIGTDEAMPIPDPAGGLMKDHRGALILTKLDTSNLGNLAQMTGGVFAMITVDDQDLRQLENGFLKNKTLISQEETELQQMKWHDQGYLFALFALPFVSLLFRRGAFIAIFIFTPYLVQASLFENFWQTQDQQAQHLFQEEKYGEASNLFQNAEWKAACSYKLGEYEQAAQLFKDISTVDGMYNYGTAKAKSGDFQSALEAYNQVLEQNPEHEDALYNKNLIEEFLKNNQNQDQKKPSKSDKDKDKQSQDQKDENQSSGQEENEGGQSQENEDKGDQSQDQDGGGKQSQKQEKNKSTQKQSSDESSGDEGTREKNQPNQQKKDGKDQKPKQSQGNDSLNDKEENNYEKDIGKGKNPEEIDNSNLDELKEKFQEDVDNEIQKNEAGLPKDKKAEIAQEMESDREEDQQKQIDERWLKRVHDDPSGLLRRKFQQQYLQQQKAKKS